jgi:hypothetical protein
VVICVELPSANLGRLERGRAAASARRGRRLGDEGRNRWFGTVAGASTEALEHPSPPPGDAAVGMPVLTRTQVSPVRRQESRNSPIASPFQQSPCQPLYRVYQKCERWELLLTTEASRDPGGNVVSGSPLESFLRDRPYGNVPIRAIMGTLGLCPLELRCTVLLVDPRVEGPHNQEYSSSLGSGRRRGVPVWGRVQGARGDDWPRRPVRQYSSLNAK